jgi:acyl dehydratase
MNILHAAIGTELPPLVKPPITQEQLRRYAEASGDHNPIHLDAEAAHLVGLDNVIAHGMLSMAFLAQFVTQELTAIPDAYLAHLRVRFMNMVRLGDTLTCHGFVKDRATDEQGHAAITIECWAQNQKGEKVTAGDVLVSVPRTSRHEVKA